MSHRTLVGAVCVVLGLATAAWSQVRRPPIRPATTLPAGTRVERDLAYVQNGSKAQVLDLYVPAGTTGPLPVIVWIHGGAWRMGSKNHCPAVRFLSQGYAAASIGYRFSQEAVFPAQIHDCKAAVRFLRANAQKYGLDPDRIGVWGASAGGHLAALLGTSGDVKELEGDLGNNEQSSRVQAVCNWFGPADFLRLWPPAAERRDGAGGVIGQLLGGAGESLRQKAILASPTSHATKDDAPMLIMHGERDLLVPMSQSEAMLDALKKAGVEVHLERLPNAGHGGGGFTTPENLKLIDEFFARQLKAPATRPAAR